MKQRAVTLAYSVWTAVRFFIFAAGGLYLLCFSGGMLYSRLAEDDMKHTIHPALGIILLAAASCSILYGIGKWGRWLYLLVLGTCPFIFIALLFGMAKLAPGMDKGFGILWAIFSILVSLAGLWPVGLYYERLAARERLISPLSDSTSLSGSGAPKQ
jgi:hypothetical protein